MNKVNLNQLIQDSIGDKFYIILEGSVGIFINFKSEEEEEDEENEENIEDISQPVKQKLIKIIEKGQYFGELALINNQCRSATIIC